MKIMFLEITKRWKIALIILSVLFGALFFCASPAFNQVLLAPVEEEEYALLQEYALGTARTFNTEELEKAGISVTTNIRKNELQVTVSRQWIYVCANYPVLSNSTEVKNGVVLNRTSYDLDNGIYTRYQECGWINISEERTPIEVAGNWVLMFMVSVLFGVLLSTLIYLIWYLVHSLYLAIKKKIVK